MSSSLPWDEIATPQKDYNVRLIPDGGVIPAYWGRDVHGKLLFLISLTGDHRNLFMQERITVKGVDTDLRQDPATDCQLLVLTLDRQVDSDLFYTLCKSLFHSLREVHRPDVALSVTIQHLKRWRTFLSGQNSRILTIQEYRGLFAELVFLGKLLAAGLSSTAAVMAWTGPEWMHQDFIYSGRAVEVKALSSADRNTVRISSEDQLESIEEKLYLLTLTLRESRDNPVALSLNALVTHIRDLLQGESLESFDSKLAATGYVPHHEYETPKLAATNKKTYLVEKDFPKVVRSMLPAGVTSVSYQLELEKIEPFSCTFETLLEAL